MIGLSLKLCVFQTNLKCQNIGVIPGKNMNSALKFELKFSAPFTLSKDTSQYW